MTETKNFIYFDLLRNMDNVTRLEREMPNNFPMIDPGKSEYLDRTQHIIFRGFRFSQKLIKV